MTPAGGSSGYKLICFTCSEEGHRSTQCPRNNKGERQGSKEAKAKPVKRVWQGQLGHAQLSGTVSGQQTMIVMDSGADITLVPESLINPSQLTGGTVAVKAFGARDPLLLPTAEVPFKIGEAEWVEGVGVVPRQEGVEEEVLYSLDLRSQRGFALVKMMNEGDPKEVKRVTTRAQTTKEKQEAEEERAELAVCKPKVKPLSPSGQEVGNEPREEVEPEEVGPEEGEPEEIESEEREEAEVVGEDTSELIEEELYQMREELEKEPELEVPVVKEGRGDRDALIAESKTDPSLDQWRKLADKGEGGFVWENGLLHQEVRNQALERELVLVLPQAFRRRVLVVAHDKMQHIGARRVTRLVKQRFTWPGVGQDIIKFCRACPICQKCSKRKSRKALMIERPVMSEPYEVIAVDLVGPIKAGKGGCTHLLTAVCMATRWPETLPMKSTTARAVAIGLCDIFSRTGIPLQLLSDQGSQFIGSVVKHLCEWLHIEQIKTTPYHPEGNGVVERMHGTLGAMLRKAAREGKDWVGQVPFALFALRAAPNRDTGFSPFELVYGRRVRTPLDVIHQGWAQVDFEELDCGEWADWLVEKLECWHDIMRERGAEASKKRKEGFDKKAVTREFELGDLVLCRVPGMVAKLEESWHGPYPVVGKLNRVDYRVEMSKGKPKVLHINNLKRFQERELEVLRLAVVAEDFGEDESVGVVIMQD